MTSADHVCLLCMRETPLPHQTPCPFCGGDDRTLPLQPPALPPRTVLDHRYVVGRTLGQGGFGITYQAYDLRMGNTVAIKEYYPSSLAGRDPNGSAHITVNAIKGEKARDEYANGLRHFLFEARRQAKLASSPGIVSVTDFFEANGTAYYVMEYVDGCTLVKYIDKPLDFASALQLLEPIADSLVSVHQAGLIHRDTSPDNIMWAKNGQRKLLDFGASHSFAEEESTTGNATLKHGFAPPEQYGSSSMQGPWTDVYAFAATIYWCLTGKIPQDSMDRSIGGDRLCPPSELGAAISPDAEAVLMRGMALPVTARYQDMETFWTKLRKAQLYSARRPSGGSPFTEPGGPTVQAPSVEGGMTSLHSSVSHSNSQTAAPVQPEEEVRVFQSSRKMEAAEDSVMESPEPTIRPVGLRDIPVSSKLPRVAEPEVEGPDITQYRRPEQGGAAQAEETETERKAPERKPRSRMTPVLVGVILALLVLVGYLTLNRPAIAPGAEASAEETAVTIGGNTYAADTTELYLTGDAAYVGRYRKDQSYTTLSYLSESDWAGLCSLTGLKKLSLVGFDLNSLSGLENLTGLEVLDVSDNDLTDLTPLNGLHLNELYAADNQLTVCPGYGTLVYLDLSGNQITDVSPLNSVRRLTTLYLQNNAVTDLTPLSDLTSLKTLDIAGNGLSSIAALHTLTNLNMLYVEGNSLTNGELVAFCQKVPACALDVDVLKNIPDQVEIGGDTFSTSVTHLDLESRNLRDGDIDNLKYMVNLTRLDIAGNNLSDFSVLSRMYSLKYLDIGHNQCRDLSFLSGLTNLDTLLISSNLITDLTPLEGLTNLENLSAGNNPIVDLTPLSGLKRLKMIAICDFRASSLEPLYPLTGLVELRISKNTYSESELKGLQEALPRCTVNQFKSKD